MSQNSADILRDLDYLIDDVVADAYVRGAEGLSTEVSPASAKTLSDAIAAALDALLPPTDIEAGAETVLKAQRSTQPNDVYDRIVATSQAISLKRIADALDNEKTPSVGASVSEPRSGKSMPGKDASRTVPQASHEDNRVEATPSDPQQPALRTGVASGPTDPKRKHGYTVNLTEEEMDTLEALAKEHGLPPWRVLLQGLRLYQLTVHPVDLGPKLDPSLAQPAPDTAIREAALEEAAKWHDEQAEECRRRAKSDGGDDETWPNRARVHSESAAAIRSIAVQGE